MPIKALQKAISAVLDDPLCSAEVFFLLEKEGALELTKPDMEQQTQAELANDFIVETRSKLIEPDGISLLDLTAADERSEVIYKYDLAEIPVKLDKLKEVLAAANIRPFDFDSDRLEDLTAILIIIGTHASQLVLYKHQYPVLLLKKSGFSISRMGQSKRFKKLESDILRINSKFEFFLMDGEFYILDVKTLERFYGFGEAVKNVAIQAIEKIAESGLTVTIDMLSARLDDLSFSRKIARAAKNSPVLGKISNDRVISFATKHPALAGKLALSADGTQFLLKTKSSQLLFLKLLNDDYLFSQLTEKDYDSLAKDGIDL